MIIPLLILEIIPPQGLLNGQQTPIIMSILKIIILILKKIRLQILLINPNLGPVRLKINSGISIPKTRAGLTVIQILPMTEQAISLLVGVSGMEFILL